MMTVTNEDETEKDHPRAETFPVMESSSDFTDKGGDGVSSKSYYPDSDSSGLQVSSEVNDREDSKTPLGSEDGPDSAYSVYKSTTESVDSKAAPYLCSCCDRVASAWGSFKFKCRQFDARQWKIIIIICMSTLTSSLSVCLFPPFFPRLAEEKGHSATVYGMVIGTNCLVSFIVTPFIGRYMNVIGVKFAFVAGMLGSGYCCCLSGFLEYFPHGYKFVLVAVLIRIVHATSNAGVITSSLSFIACEFPDSVAFLFSITRAMMNLAQMFGPAVGGALHSVGGFKLPFIVLGSLHILVSIVCFIFMPSLKGQAKSETSKNESLSGWSVFKIPGLWVSFSTFIFSTMSNGFLSITLEPQILRHFNVSPLVVGILFGLKDGANCFASPIWGWMCDRTSKLKILIIIGSVLTAASFILLGPFPGLSIGHTLGIVIISLILNGFGIGGQQVSGVVSAMKDAIYAGYPDEPETHAFIAGLWSSLSGAGRFISRAGSGILVDNIGFKYTSLIVTGLNFAIIVITTLYLLLSRKRNSKSGKRQSYCPIHVDNSPSEPIASKTASVKISSVLQEDLEGSFIIGSSSSRKLFGNI